ncbi:MAG TPA: DsbA family protein [Candidatus Thermoplasmatota archaeon]|nr:DsbA family protein [Candidatus Thermoplasmatota archaeon]
MSEVHVVHATAPGCTWSWGYEPVLNRLRLVYGDQVKLHVPIGCPYEDYAQWLKDYEMGEQEAMDWLNESSGVMGLPFPRYTIEKIPWNVLPASLATMAAMRQGEREGWRFHRRLLRRVVVEQQDPADEAVPLAAAEEVGLDLARFRRDYADDAGLREQLSQQGADAPPVHVGFYNVAVTDGVNRRVILDYAFDPAVVEGAIDYISGGTLTKRRPTDVLAYLQEHGFSSLVEIQRVFALSPGEAQARLEALEKRGAAERGVLAGAPHWRATGVGA